MATNLAASFAKHEGRRTLLLDLDLQFGDAAIMLGLEPEKTIYDLVVAPGELDSEKLAGYITKHPCGLDVLPAPLRPEDAELVTEGEAGPAARGGAGVVRRDRRRHVAVLPRADAGDARPDRRAADGLRARRPDAEERAPVAADARAALVPAAADPLRPQPRQLEGRDEAEARSKGRSRSRSASRCRPTGPCRSASTAGMPPVLADTGSDFAKAIARWSPSRCSPLRRSRRRRSAHSRRWRGRRSWVSTTASRSRTGTGPRTRSPSVRSRSPAPLLAPRCRTRPRLHRVRATRTPS